MEQYQKNYSNDASQLKVVKCQSLDNFHEGLAAIKQGNRWGYIDVKGEMVIPCQFKYTYGFSEGLACVTNSENKEGYINKQGKLVIPYQYTFADDFKEGLATVEDNQKNFFGFINSEGKVVIQKEYYFADGFQDGLSCVAIQKDDDSTKYGYINREGEVVIECKYDDASGFHNGFARVETKEYLIIINKKGEEIFKIPNNEINILEIEGEIVLYHEGINWQFKNLLTGLSTTLSNIESFAFIKDGLCFMTNIEGRMGALNKEAQTVIPFVYDDLGQANEGTIPYLKKGMYGFIDYNGKVILAPQYDAAEAFNSGLAKVKKGEKEFFIDQKGEPIFQVKRKEKNTSNIILIGIIIFWIAFIILALI